MSLLTATLILKIAGTALLFIVPLLLLPSGRLLKLAGLPAEALGAVPTFRLLGVAYIALLVGYASGFPQIAVGQFPWGVVAMGIASNGGSAATLVATGAWRKPLSRVGLAFTLLITALLFLTAFLGETAIRPL